jgi:signal transduction histidine kinase
MRQTFSTIGVEITIDGELPKDKDIAVLFADISREAVTNAVRHGYALRITIRMETQTDSYLLSISDNGQVASKPFTEGGGIGGMRDKLKPFGGKLEINTVERFTLIVTVPLLTGKEADGL